MSRYSSRPIRSSPRCPAFTGSASGRSGAASPSNPAQKQSSTHSVNATGRYPHKATFFSLPQKLKQHVGLRPAAFILPLSISTYFSMHYMHYISTLNSTHYIPNAHKSCPTPALTKGPQPKAQLKLWAGHGLTTSTLLVGNGCRSSGASPRNHQARHVADGQPSPFKSCDSPDVDTTLDRIPGRIHMLLVP